jgi:hypothetical protein
MTKRILVRLTRYFFAPCFCLSFIEASSQQIEAGRVQSAGDSTSVPATIAPPEVRKIADDFVVAHPPQPPLSVTELRNHFLMYFFLGFTRSDDGQTPILTPDGDVQSLATVRGFVAGRAFSRANRSRLEELMRGFGYELREVNGTFDANVFTPRDDPKESWWCIPLDEGQKDFDKHARPPRPKRKELRIRGFVSPKGHYGDLGSFERELLCIAISPAKGGLVFRFPERNSPPLESKQEVILYFDSKRPPIIETYSFDGEWELFKVDFDSDGDWALDGFLLFQAEGDAIIRSWAPEYYNKLQLYPKSQASEALKRDKTFRDGIHGFRELKAPSPQNPVNKRRRTGKPYQDLIIKLKAVELKTSPPLPKEEN